MDEKKQLLSVEDIVKSIKGRLELIGIEEKWRRETRLEVLRIFFERCVDNEVPYSTAVNRIDKLKTEFVSRSGLKAEGSNNPKLKQYKNWSKNYEKDYLALCEEVYSEAGEFDRVSQDKVEFVSNISKDQAKEFYKWMKDNVTKNDGDIAKMANIYSSAFGMFIDDLISGRLQ